MNAAGLLPHYLPLSKVLLSSVNECTCTSTPLINQNSAPLLQSNYRLLQEGLIRDEIRHRFVEFHYLEFSHAYFIYLLPGETLLQTSSIIPSYLSSCLWVITLFHTVFSVRDQIIAGLTVICCTSLVVLLPFSNIFARQ